MTQHLERKHQESDKDINELTPSEIGQEIAKAVFNNNKRRLYKLIKGPYKEDNKSYTIESKR